MLLIQKWLESRLPGASRIEAASADASFRRYFRTECGGKTYVIMDAPPEKEDSRPFVRIAQWLESHHLPAPRVLSFDQEQGLMLLDDLGRKTLLDHLTCSEDCLELYRRAIDLLIAMQLAGQQAGLEVPLYDDALLSREMDLFRDWYVSQQLGEDFEAADEKIFASIKARLVAAVCSQPMGLVHRDFHSRNLMLDASGRLAMLDFQDAVHGPLSYDLISLLRDSYFKLGATRETDLREYYRVNAISASLLPASTSAEAWQRGCAAMALQRHLKVIGIFSRLWLRDGKRQYLGDIPLTRDYLLELLPFLPEPEANWLSGWLHEMPGEAD